MFIPLHDGNPLQVIRHQFVTLGLIALNVLVFLYTRTLPEDVLQAFNLSFGAIPAVLTDRADLEPSLQVIPETATALTYMFLHGGWMHLIGNMLFLWVFADNVEDSLGHVRFLLFYLACGIAALAAHTLFAPNSQLPLVGASGAVSGVLAAYMVLFPRVQVLILLLMRLPLRISALWVLGGWFVWQLIASQLSSGATAGGVAWWAHIGGFIAGLILILPFRRRLLARLAGGER